MVAYVACVLHHAARVVVRQRDTYQGWGWEPRAVLVLHPVRSSSGFSLSLSLSKSSIEPLLKIVRSFLSLIDSYSLPLRFDTYTHATLRTTAQNAKMRQTIQDPKEGRFVVGVDFGTTYKNLLSFRYYFLPLITQLAASHRSRLPTLSALRRSNWCNRGATAQQTRCPPN